MQALQTPTPRHRDSAGTAVETSAGPARVLPLADGRWAVVSDNDLFSAGIGETPSEALAAFERRNANH